MLWLDNILAVPAIGIRIKVEISELVNFRDNIIPFFDFLNKKYEKIEVKQKKLFGFSVEAPNLSYTILPDNIIADYEYNVLQQEVSGSFPKTLTPELKSYTELLALIFDDIKYVIDIVGKLKHITYDRIGIVAKVNLSQDSLPPGIISWIKYLSRPWGMDIIKCETLLLVKLNESIISSDQCHHLINFNETTPEKGYEFKLDWQRIFKEPRPINFGKIIVDIEACKTEAINYFENFGAGDLNYD